MDSDSKRPSTLVFGPYLKGEPPAEPARSAVSRSRDEEAEAGSAMVTAAVLVFGFGAAVLLRRLFDE
jgi:hypothetical protein